MKHYLLNIYQPDGDPPASAVLDKIMRDVDAVRQEMQAAGAWVFSAGLHPPSTATVVRIRDGEVLMTDGPFAEGKEHVGGFTIIVKLGVKHFCMAADTTILSRYYAEQGTAMREILGGS
jgi:hypothetical protein